MAGKFLRWCDPRVAAIHYPAWFVVGYLVLFFLFGTYGNYRVLELRGGIKERCNSLGETWTFALPDIGTTARRDFRSISSFGLLTPRGLHADTLVSPDSESVYPNP